MRIDSYKFQYPDLTQPKKKSDPLYDLLDEFLIRGDQKEIAAALNIKSEGVISDVKNGRARNRRVWDQFMIRVKRRQEEREKITQYGQRPMKAA